MTKETIFEKIIEILKSKLLVTAELSGNTALLADDILDSMEFMKYLTVVEEEFEVSISDEDLETGKLGIINNMVGYLFALKN
jgi:acyl carrier protein